MDTTVVPPIRVTKIHARLTAIILEAAGRMGVRRTFIDWGLKNSPHGVRPPLTAANGRDVIGSKSV
jgi:hypothetical protein